MKITKRQLRRIIKEEAQLLNESMRMIDRYREYFDNNISPEEVAQEVFEDWDDIELARKIVGETEKTDPQLSSYVYEIADEMDGLHDEQGRTMFDEPDRHGGSRYRRY